MLLALAAILGGIVVLAWAADQFVLGAARVALIKRVPSIVVGVVIVGFGTSAPEMLVSAIAATRGETDVAVGNVIGSNIANLSLLLGIGAIMVPLATSSRTVRREAPLVVAAVVAFGLAVQGGSINRYEGAGLLVAMAAALWFVTRSSPDDQLGADVVDLADTPHHRLSTETVRTIVGLGGTIGAAQLLLWGAIDVAQRLELSEAFIGATLVAVGTSLPELVTVVQSARRHETDLIIGNLLGSNLFNALAVGGIIGLIGGPDIAAPSLTRLAVIASIAVAATATIAMRTNHTVTRREGAVLVVAYLALLPLLA